MRLCAASFPWPLHVSMEKEVIDLVDEDDNVVGVTDVETAHKLKQSHRAVGVFVFSEDGKLYLQKENQYGRYDNAVGGHVARAESYDDAAQRKLEEELGLTIPLKKVSIFLPPQARLNHRWALYEGIAPTGWEFRETEEVKTLELMNFEAVIALMNTNPEIFTHGLINTMREYIRVKSRN